MQTKQPEQQTQAPQSAPPAQKLITRTLLRQEKDLARAMQGAFKVGQKRETFRGIRL